MARSQKTSLASIFDEEPSSAPAPDLAASSSPASHQGLRKAALAPTRRDSHPGKKPVLIHIPEDMHRTLRQLSVEVGGEPITKIVERSLRDYLVRRGHTKYGSFD